MRGQTTLDFAIGISVFMAVMLFVFAFVPGILTPFTSANERQTVSVGRTADNLAQGRLGSPSEPYVLDRECTVAFFENSGAYPPGCSFSVSDLNEQLNLDAGTNVNVTILGNTSDDVTSPNTPDDSDILCWSGEHNNLTELGAGSHPTEDPCDDSGDVPLIRGGKPPSENDATIAAFRVVNLAGESVTLKVVMW